MYPNGYGSAIFTWLYPCHVKRFIRFQTIDNTFLLSFLKTPSIGPDPEIESATSCSANKRSYLS